MNKKFLEKVKSLKDEGAISADVYFYMRALINRSKDRILYVPIKDVIRDTLLSSERAIQANRIAKKIGLIKTVKTGNRYITKIIIDL